MPYMQHSTKSQGEAINTIITDYKITTICLLMK